jgi:hypothetical protein
MKYIATYYLDGEFAGTWEFISTSDSNAQVSASKQSKPGETFTVVTAGFRFRSKLLKKAYGYDTTGIVQEENQTNQRDTNKQREKVEDSPNPANIAVDGEALAEFPELKNRPNRLPTRNLF